jgi:ribosomal protein S6--L-glutamate ligase
VSSEIEAIARRCGSAFGLELFGLDIAEDAPSGPCIIDLNYFPGYRGVPNAARRLTDHIVRTLGQAA